MKTILPFFWRSERKTLPPCRLCRTRTRAYNFRGTTLFRRALAGAALRRNSGERGNGRTRRGLTIRPRSSETIFGIARPARFHPSGFLSGADEAYSSLHSQFTLLYLIYAKSAGLSRMRCQPLSLLRSIRPGCGTQHPQRFARVLLAAAPTTTPCFCRWQRSSSLPLPRGASGEEGKRYDMPRPLLQGEVARRRRDGEVGRRKACRNQKERVKLHNPSRPGSYNRAAPCCRPRPHEPDAWSSP